MPISMLALGQAHVRPDPLAAEILRARLCGVPFAQIASRLGYAERTVRAKCERALDIALVPIGLEKHDAWVAGAWSAMHFACCLAHAGGQTPGSAGTAGV